MNSILNFHFDESTENLQQLATGLISRFEVTEFSIDDSYTSGFKKSKEHINGFGGARLQSPNVQKGFIIGGAESEEILKKSKEKIRHISINCNNQIMISLYVNSEDIIRGFIFFDGKSIIENKKKSSHV